ncbi:methyltransferase domain-containing protein, partial [Candidatus Poribacteria bacterium]|nr:methyltransferase domain-containing protein [Candidatus Poribacteria bacterium]
MQLIVIVNRQRCLVSVQEMHSCFAIKKRSQSKRVKLCQSDKPTEFEMHAFYSVNPIGELYIPEECREAVFARGSVKLFTNQELEQLSRIFTHIQRGGVAIVEGEWEQIISVTDYVNRHKRELSTTGSERGRKGKSRHQRSTPKQNREAAISKLMCWADKDGSLQVSPTPELPYLLELIGEPPNVNEDCPFLVPVVTIQSIQSALEETYPIDALGVSLVASKNVLAPRSQETVACFQEAMQSLESYDLPNRPVIADVGCGSGCLTLLAHQEFGENAVIYASDILSEAIATTRINVQHLLPLSKNRGAENIHVMPAGDLFAPFTSQQFDVVIFNAPWVVARVRNRSELAIHDEKQQTLRRFFEQVPNYLKPDGTILLGYADASGPKAISNLETIIADSGFTYSNIIKRRVAT